MFSRPGLLSLVLCHDNLRIQEGSNSTGMLSCQPSLLRFLHGLKNIFAILSVICGHNGRGTCSFNIWCPWRCTCKRVSSLVFPSSFLSYSAFPTTTLKKSTPYDAYSILKTSRLNSPSLVTSLPLTQTCTCTFLSRKKTWALFQLAKETAESTTQSPIGGQARQPTDFPEATNSQQDATGEKDALPPGWKASKDQNGNVYYYNKELKVTQWSRPEELKVVAHSRWV